MSSSSLSLTSSSNPTPNQPEDISPNNIPLSPHSVEENLFANEEFEDESEDEPEDEEEIEAGYEEDDEEEEEEEAPNQPPNPVHQGLRIRFIVNRPTVGTLAPLTTVSTPPSESSSNTPTMSRDQYPPPGYIPLPTYPRLAREITDHHRRICQVEDTIDLFPEPHQIDTMRQNIQQLEHATRQLTTRLPIVDNQRYNEQRILDLENQVGKMQAQIDAMNQMIADTFRRQK